VTFDLRPLARRLEQKQATLDCLCCGSSDVSYSDTRYALIELDSDDQLAVEQDWGLTSNLFCAARVCNACGFVHLHALLPIES
jgi:hypothetical protein